MPAPVWQSTGAGQGNAGALSVPWGTHQAGDLGFLVVETDSQTLSAPSGWTEHPLSPVSSGGGTTSTRLHLFYKLAASGAEANVVVPDTGDHQVAFIAAFRPSVAGQIYLDTSAANSGSGTSVGFNDTPTTNHGELIVSFLAYSTDTTTPQASAWTNGNLLSFIEHGDFATNAGRGGGVAFACGEKQYAGSVGNSTCTLGSSVAWANIQVTLTDVAPANVVNSTEALPFGGSVTIEKIQRVDSSKALPFSGLVAVEVLGQVTSTSALPFGGTTEFAGVAEATVDSNKALPFAGSVDLDNPVVASSSKTLPFAGSVVFGQTQRVESNKALPLAGSATFVAQQFVSSSKALPFGGSTSLAVALVVSSTRALPFAGTLAFGSGVQVDSSKSLPFVGSTTVAVQTNLVSSKALPLGGSASLGSLVQLGSTKALPLGGSSSVSVALGVDSTAPLLLGGTAEFASEAAVDSVGALGISGVTEFSLTALAPAVLQSTNALPFAGVVNLQRVVGATVQPGHFFSPDDYPTREKTPPRRLVASYENESAEPEFDYIRHNEDGSRVIGRRLD